MDSATRKRGPNRVRAAFQNRPLLLAGRLLWACRSFETSTLGLGKKISVWVSLGLMLVAGVWVALHVHPGAAEAKVKQTLENEILLLLIEIGLILGLSRVMGILLLESASRRSLGR